MAFQISSLVNWSVFSMILFGLLLGKIPMLMNMCSNRLEKKHSFSEPWSNSSPRTDDPVIGFHRVFPFHGWRRGAISKPMIRAHQQLAAEEFMRTGSSISSYILDTVPFGSRYDVFMFGYCWGNTTCGRSVKCLVMNTNGFCIGIQYMQLYINIL